jgi:hypothetical protein
MMGDQERHVNSNWAISPNAQAWRHRHIHSGVRSRTRCHLSIVYATMQSPGGIDACVRELKAKDGAAVCDFGDTAE